MTNAVGNGYPESLEQSHQRVQTEIAEAGNGITADRLQQLNQELLDAGWQTLEWDNVREMWTEAYRKIKTGQTRRSSPTQNCCEG